MYTIVESVAKKIFKKTLSKFPAKVVSVINSGTAKVRLANDDVELTLLNKTGEILSAEDSVLVEAIDGNLTGGFISERFGYPVPAAASGTPGVGLQFTWNGTQLGVKREDQSTYSYVELKGAEGDKGDTGDQGNSLEFTWNGTQLGVRVQGQTTYQYVDLKGEQGIQGVKGDTGEQGIQGVKGDKGDRGDTGIQGNSLEFNWNGTQLGIRIQGQTEYQYIDLKGSTGETGVGLQFNWDGTSLGVKREIDSTYTYVNLKGDPGSFGKRTSRFTIGTSLAGWTTDDCDYLCDGADDNIEINAAITALPTDGGEIVILDGVYNITDSVKVNKSNVKINGNGSATVLKRMWDTTSESDIAVMILNSVGGCNINDLKIDGNRSNYTGESNYGVFISGDNNAILNTICISNIIGIACMGQNNTISNNICNDNISPSVQGEGSGIYSVYDNIITENICNNNFPIGIAVFEGSPIISNNICKNNMVGIENVMSSGGAILNNICIENDYGMFIESNKMSIVGNTCFRGTGTPTDYTAEQYTIKVGESKNIVSSNICMGKAVVDEGTSNTLFNNKWDESDDFYLPIATTSVLGGIKPDGTTITVDPSTGVASSSSSEGEIPVVTTSGTSTAYTVTIEGVSAYTNGLMFFMNMHTANTGYDTTVNVNELGAIDIYINVSSSYTSGIGPGTLLAGMSYLVCYEGGSFYLMTNICDTVYTEATQTLKSKRIEPRIYSMTSTSSLTITSDYRDVIRITALAEAMTINAPTGTPTLGQKLLLYIKDNGTARALTWDSIFTDIYGVALPTSTVAGKQIILGFIYNSATSKWDYISRAVEA